MKKILLAAFISATFSLSALNITTKDGKTYKNVSVSSITPVGFDISYIDKNGNMAMRGLRFVNLPASIQKKYGYNPQKAEVFEKRTIKYRDKLIAKRLETVKENEEIAQDYEHVRAMVFSRRMANVLLTISRQTHGGALADVSSEYATLTTGHYSRVFVYGMEGQRGVTWEGCIYPTGTFINLSDGSYPAFSTSLEIAVMSVCRHIQNSIQANKKK